LQKCLAKRVFIIINFNTKKKLDLKKYQQFEFAFTTYEFQEKKIDENEILTKPRNHHHFLFHT